MWGLIKYHIYTCAPPRWHYVGHLLQTLLNVVRENAEVLEKVWRVSSIVIPYVSLAFREKLRTSFLCRQPCRRITRQKGLCKKHSTGVTPCPMIFPWLTHSDQASAYAGNKLDCSSVRTKNRVFEYQAQALRISVSQGRAQCAMLHMCNYHELLNQDHTPLWCRSLPRALTVALPSFSGTPRTRGKRSWLWCWRVSWKVKWHRGHRQQMAHF
jgi:hypothetical protein